MSARIVARRLAAPGPSRLVRYSSTASAAAPAAFEPALPAGAEPAYDLALEYLNQDNAVLQKRLETLRAKAAASPSDEIARRIARLEIDAFVNDPATRRLFRQTAGKGHMGRAVMRSLAERAWRKEGELDLVMERVMQLGVVPDLIPDHKPQAALRISTAESPVEAGTVLSSAAFAAPPTTTVQLFEHPAEATASSPAPEAKFTLLVIDPDSPNHEALAFAQRVHYAKTDIPLSVLSGETNLFSAAGNEVLGYEAPAPARGSGKHRYVFLVVRQGETPVAATTRDNFDLRAFLTASNLTAEDVVAVTLFRSQWTEADNAHIDATYREHRGIAAPEYAKPPKELKYGYPLSAKQQKVNDIRDAAWDRVVSEIEASQQGQLPAEPQQQ